MKKLFIFLALLVFFFLNTSSVSAQEAYAVGQCTNSKQPILSLKWDVGKDGEDCTIFIREGQKATEISNDCNSNKFPSSYREYYAVKDCEVYNFCAFNNTTGVQKCVYSVQIPNCTVTQTTFSCTAYVAPTPPPLLQPKTVDSVFGRIEPPQFIKNIGFGAGGINQILNTLVVIIYVVAGVVAVFMVIFSAFEFITSGGDKEKVAGARKRLTYAIIGLVILGLAGVLIYTLGQILGFELFRG